MVTSRIREALWLRALLLVLLVVPVGSGCKVSESPITGRTRAYAYSWEQEVQLGKEADAQIIAQYGLYDNEALTRYVERIGERVLAESHLRREDTDPQFRNTPFTFRVLDSPVINAFALPGGYSYVTRGLLAHLNNEAQLAMVLGHEVAHVAARHASQRALNQQLGQLGLIGGAVLGQSVLGGQAAETILGVGSNVAQLLFLSYGRDDERESDRLGVEYAALSGYQAGEGAAFFRSLDRIRETQGGSIPFWASTHPDPGEREETIQELAAEWSQRTSMTRLNADAYLGAIDGIIVGENPRQGFTRDDVFYHPDLQFRFPVPAGFSVINQTARVALVEENQNAVVIFQIDPEARSAQSAGSEFAGQQGLTVVDQRRTRVDGLPAYAVLANAETQDGQRLRLLTYFIEYQGRVYSFVGYAPAGSFADYEDAFVRTMQGFGRLTDPDILDVQPRRLYVTLAPRSAPFQTFLPRDLPEDLTAEELAIINQVELDERVERGRPLKLPR